MAAGAAAALTHRTELCREEDVERLHVEGMAERARVPAATQRGESPWTCLRTTRYMAG